MINNDTGDNIKNEFIEAVKQEDINYVTATLNSLRERKSEEGETAVLKLVDTEVEGFWFKNTGYYSSDSNDMKLSCTPLIIAISKNNTDLVDILLKNGANSNLTIFGISRYWIENKGPIMVKATNALGFIFYLISNVARQTISLDIVHRLLPKIIDLNPIVQGMGDDRSLCTTACYGKICDVLKQENQEFLECSKNIQFAPYYKEILVHVAVECLLRGKEENISLVRELYTNSIIDVNDITAILDSYLKVRRLSSSELQNLIKCSEEIFYGRDEDYFSFWETIAEKHVDNNIQILPANYPQALKSYMTKADKVKNVSRTLEYLVGHLQMFLGFDVCSYAPDASVIQMQEGGELAKKREKITQKFEKKIFKYIEVVTEKALNEQIVECRRQKQSSMFLMKLEERYYFVGEDINGTRLEGYIDEIPLIGLCSKHVLGKDSTTLLKRDEIKKIIIEDLFRPEKALADMLSDQNYQDTLSALCASECDKDLILTLCELVTDHSDRLEQCKNNGVKNKIIKLIEDYENSDPQAIEIIKALNQLEKRVDKYQGNQKAMEKQIQQIRELLSEKVIEISGTGNDSLQQFFSDISKRLKALESEAKTNKKITKNANAIRNIKRELDTVMQSSISKGKILRSQIQEERKARKALEGRLQEGERKLQDLRSKMNQLAQERDEELQDLRLTVTKLAMSANQRFFGESQEQRLRRLPKNNKEEDRCCVM